MELLQDSGGLFSEAFGASDGSSPKMKRGILEWLRLYYGTDQRLQIPYTIVRKLVSAVYSEYNAPGLAELPEREALVIKLRYFHGMTQDRASKVLEVSQVQVSRIEKRVLEKLRVLMT